MNCKHCEKEIPTNNVQQGGMHIDCYNEEIDLYKICHEGTCYIDEGFPEDHEGYEVEKIKMCRGDFYHLPEFEGF